MDGGGATDREMDTEAAEKNFNAAQEKERRLGDGHGTRLRCDKTRAAAESTYEESTPTPCLLHPPPPLQRHFWGVCIIIASVLFRSLSSILRSAASPSLFFFSPHDPSALLGHLGKPQCQ